MSDHQIVRVYAIEKAVYIDAMDGKKLVERQQVEGQLATMTMIDFEIIFNLTNILASIMNMDVVYDSEVIDRWNELKRAANQS